MPSVMTTGQGDMVLGCTVASSQEFINGAFASRSSTDFPGTLSSPVLFTNSSTSYNPSGGSGGSGRRWGDYSYTSLDPFDNMTVYSIQEYCNAQNSWGVQIAALLAPPPATPQLVTPAIVLRGLPSVDIVVTALSISGSVFYDPGAGYRRPRATITGGVLVNSTTYLSPTSVRLNISTVAANLGLQNITVINPDNQARTGTLLLAVV